MNEKLASRTAEWPAGFAINPRPESIPAAVIAAYHDMPTAFVSDSLGRSVGGLGLRPYHGDAFMCGMAFTVLVRPGDNLMIHKAIELAAPGDVIVVDGGGDLTQALVGGNMRAQMLKRKLGGLVLNGALRDVAEWREGNMPAFALGCVHRGPSKEGPGQINVPISCAGLVVNPGDLVLGDPDGVVAVRRDEMERLIPRLVAQVEKEKNIRAAISDGTADPERFNAVLRKKGCPV